MRLKFYIVIQSPISYQYYNRHYMLWLVVCNKKLLKLFDLKNPSYEKINRHSMYWLRWHICSL